MHLAFLIAAVMVLAATRTAGRQDGARAPETVKDVMVTMTVPASDVVFDAAVNAPASDGQWTALEGAGRTLAESGRLLMTAERARDGTTWMERARALVTEAERVLALAKARSRDGLEAASDQVYETCEACHMRYLEGAQ